MEKKEKVQFTHFDEQGNAWMVDVGAKAEIYKLLGELAENGISIVMVSSDMPELVSVSDRVLVIGSGKITGEFKKEEISEEAIMAAAIT